MDGVDGMAEDGEERRRRPVCRRERRRMMQTYCCQHCGISSHNTLELFLHIFTRHLHKDIALGKEESCELMMKMCPYMVTEYAFSLN